MARRTPISKKCKRCVTRKPYRDFLTIRKGTPSGMGYGNICDDCRERKSWIDKI